MKFSISEPSVDFDVARFLSDTGKWEFGIRRLMFGLRVCGNPVWDCGYWIDYCAGDNVIFAVTLLATVTKILERYPEDVTLKQIKQDFPSYEVRPINKDPYCWKRLQEIAAHDNQR